MTCSCVCVCVRLAAGNMRSCGRPRDEKGGGPIQFRDPYGGGGGGGGGNFYPMGYQSNGQLGPISLAGFPPPMPPVPQATLGGQMQAVLGGQMVGDPSNPEFLQVRTCIETAHRWPSNRLQMDMFG